jgi:dTDP-4-dehydrorhamnose 3,5-epimerase
MELIPTGIEGLVIIRPDVYEDGRGYFFESFQEKTFREIGIDERFVQDNESKSMKGVLRGLHFQAPPHAQGKLVRVVKGAVLDVSVDIRKESPTYGQWKAYRLDEREKVLIWVPKGFAHGFLVLEDDTIFQYKCTGYYHKPSEGSVRWDDPDLGIDWGIGNPLLSDKDRDATLFRDLKSPF